jgi:hypothetical protein
MPQNDLQAIPKEQFYDRQLLKVEDFLRERDFHIAHRELQTRLLYSRGCLTGLTVEKGPGQSQVQVAPGVAIDGYGRQIILFDSARFDGRRVPEHPGKLVIDLTINPLYYSVEEDKCWLLTVAFNEETVTDNQLNQVPLLSLIDATTAQPGDAAHITLARLKVHAKQLQPVAPSKVGVVTVEVQIDTTVRVNLALDASRVSELSADKITSGTLCADRLPDIPASKIPVLPPSPDSEWVRQLKKSVSVSTEGNVGIGAPQPVAKLEIKGSGSETVLSAGASSGSTCDVRLAGHIQLRQYGTSKQAYLQARDDSDPSDIGLVLGVQQAGETGKERYLEAITIDGSGNVGVGILPSDAKLHVPGTLRADQIEGSGAGITNLKASNITGLNTDELQTMWAQDVAIYAQGLKLVGRPQASSHGGFIIGLLKTETDQGSTHYSLGIGFEHRLFTFTSQELGASIYKMNVYPERTRYDLANEGGEHNDTEAATSVRFVGVDNDYTFNLLQPESQIPAASRGKIRSLVTVGTSMVNASDISSQMAASIINLFRDAVSPFSFVAVANPAAPSSLTPEELAQQLSLAGMIAPEAVAIIVAQRPVFYFNYPDQLITLMTSHFNESTRTPAQMAWTLGAAGITDAQASFALGDYYRDRIERQEFLNMTLGAFPVPSVQKAVVELQGEGKTAQEAALQLKQANPQYDKFPVQLGILLRLNFSDTASTLKEMAQALNNAGYTSREDVQDALAQLFPTTKAEEISAATNQFWNA